jgi:hypothetical protein
MLSLAQKLGVDIERDKGQGEFKFNFKRRMLWPWKEKEVNKILDTIEKHKATFSLAVSGDTLQTVLMIQADVGEVGEDVRGLKRDVSEVIRHVSVIPTFVAEQQRKDILKWLKTNNFQTNHTLARHLQPATGSFGRQPLLPGCRFRNQRYGCTVSPERGKQFSVPLSSNTLRNIAALREYSLRTFISTITIRRKKPSTVCYVL